MMKYKKYNIRGFSGMFSLFLSGLLLTGCVLNDFDDESGTQAGTQARSYVTLNFAIPSSGEEESGMEEKGLDYENKISSAVVFFYQGQGNEGVNSDGDTKILGTVKFDYLTPPSESNGRYTTTPQPVNLGMGKYNLIVIANPGNDDWWPGKSLTLKDVRDHIQKEAWCETPGEDGKITYSDFLMSQANDNSVVLDFNLNTEENPATTTINVERMAARVDYRVDYKLGKSLLPCEDGTGSVEITGAALVNNLTAGSYLLKRVLDKSAENISNVRYLGEENEITYVIAPWTIRSIGNDSILITIDEKPILGNALYDTYYPNSSQDPNWWAEYAKKGDDITDEKGKSWKRIGYTLENIAVSPKPNPYYSTGVVFKAKFHTPMENYKDGSTFFTFEGQMYPSMEAMMNKRGKNLTELDNKINACSTWSNVKEFAETIGKDPSGYSAFLKSECEKKDENVKLTSDDKKKLLWKSYMRIECGYSAKEDNGVWKVTLNQFDASSSAQSTREKLSEYNVSTYEDATCYYTYWLVHNNDNPDGIMKYAIVRNNIYQLTVTSVNALGTDVPNAKAESNRGMYSRDNNTPEEALKVDVHVNGWGR